MPFQKTVNITQAPAVAGDFASTNPRHSAVASPDGGAFVAGPNGVTAGLFCWADTATNKVLSNAGTGLPLGFLHRNLQASIVTYLTEFGSTYLPNSAVGELFNGGDFFVLNAGSTAAAIGQKVFANNTTGVATTAAAGATVAGSTETQFWVHSIAAAGELLIMSNTRLAA